MIPMVLGTWKFLSSVFAYTLAEDGKLMVSFTDRDAFAGGLLAGIVQNETLERCIDMGHWLAKLSIRELGPRYVSVGKLLSALLFPILLHGINERMMASVASKYCNLKVKILDANSPMIVPLC